MNTKQNIKQFILKNRIHLLFILFIINPNLLWSYDQMKGFSEIVIPRTNCPYEDTSKNVMELSKATTSSLQKIQNLSTGCAGVSQGAQDVQDNLAKIFATYKDKMGIPDASGEVLKVNCENYPYLFEMEYKNAMIYVSKNQIIPADNFYSDPAAMNTDTNTSWPNCKKLIILESDGDYIYSNSASEGQSFQSCIEDALAKRLYEMKTKCEISSQIVSMDDLTKKYQKNVAIVETTAKNVYQGLQSVLKNVTSKDCVEKDAILKEAFKSTVVLGANVAGTIFGGSVGGQAAATLSSIGSEVILQFVDFMDRKAQELSKLGDMEKSDNFENAACMFINVQDADCDNKYNVESVEPICKQKTKEELEEEDKLAKGTKNIFKIIDNYAKETDFGVKAGPEGVVLLKKVLEGYNMKTTLSSGEERALKDILTDAMKAYDDARDLKKLAALTKVKVAIEESEKYIKRYSRISARILENVDKDDDDSSILYKLQTVDALLAKNLTTLTGDKEYLNYIKDYVRSQVLKNSGINRIIAEDLARRIVENLDKTKIRNEGDIRRLSDLTSAMVENFRTPFEERLVTRYKESFANAYRAEIDITSHYKNKISPKITNEEAIQILAKNGVQIDTKNNPLTEKLMKDALDSKLSLKHLDKVKDYSQINEIRAARRNTFGRLRNTIKDCLSTQGIFFMKRKKLTWYNTCFSKDQTDANLTIERLPETYLQACKPFFCDTKESSENMGIPIPFLADEDSAPTDFGKYQCRIIKNFKQIYDQIEKEYVEKGIICGKTIAEITSNGSKLNPNKNDISNLETLISQGKYYGGYFHKNISAGGKDANIFNFFNIIKKHHESDEKNGSTSNSSVTAPVVTAPVAVSVKVEKENKTEQTEKIEKAAVETSKDKSTDVSKFLNLSYE
ncbi:MAG: hypothetical protein HQK51_00350 [Oligoflexia bacterium]|nr:hypothetical protein [Oligoflexia bacterium]